MSAFDKVIGYEQVKQELMQVADTLRNREVYEALGVSSPRGLLLHGMPGVGKSLMAQCLIEESGRKAFVCRKTEPDGKFVNTIKKVFKKAAEGAPSIVYLDDMDKFSHNSRACSRVLRLERSSLSCATRCSTCACEKPRLDREPRISRPKSHLRSQMNIHPKPIQISSSSSGVR